MADLIQDKKTKTIYKGADAVINATVLTKISREPFSFETFNTVNGDYIEAQFLKEDKTVLSLRLDDVNSDIEIISACGGKIKIKMDETHTSSLQEGECESFEVEVKMNNAEDTTILQAEEVLIIKKRLFS